MKKSTDYLKAIIKVISFVILLIITANPTVFGQDTSTGVRMRKYLAYPIFEAYPMSWVIVTEETFYWFHDLAGKPAIEHDSSKFVHSDTINFRIFTDHVGHNFYWIHPVLVPDTISSVFLPEEKPMEDLLKQFSGKFIIKYPYCSDTLRSGPKFETQKHFLDSVHAIGYGYRNWWIDPSGYIVNQICVDMNYGKDEIGMLVKSVATKKEILLLGESPSYGLLCRLVRSLMVYDNPREGVFRFMEQQGRARNDYAFLYRLLVVALPEAMDRMRKFTGLPDCIGHCGEEAPPEKLINFEGNEEKVSKIK